MVKLRFDDNVGSRLHFENQPQSTLKDRDFSKELGANSVELIPDCNNNFVSLYLYRRHCSLKNSK